MRRIERIGKPCDGTANGHDGHGDEQTQQQFGHDALMAPLYPCPSRAPPGGKRNRGQYNQRVGVMGRHGDNARHRGVLVYLDVENQDGTENRLEEGEEKGEQCPVTRRVALGECQKSPRDQDQQEQRIYTGRETMKVLDEGGEPFESWNEMIPAKRPTISATISRP